ncbi:MAG TPA: RodZ domain-containing protein [Rhizomicrobium sp.]|nr:RodZ domain-containing protein [Rhizomicrobium sp.]
MTKITQMAVENNGGGDSGGPNRRRIHLREISGDSESPLETVGQDLRAARLRRGDEIAQVSRALKIRKDHLEALENDRLEDLPGKTYAIGFVRSYARHLGLDAAEYVERFKRDISGRSDDQSREPAAIHLDDRRLSYGWRLIAGVVVILLAWGGWRLLSPGGEATQPVPPAPVLNAPKPASPPPPKPVVAPPQTAVPSPAADTMAPPPGRAANAPAQQGASALPPPAAGARTPATSISRNGSAALSAAPPIGAASAPATTAAAPGAAQVFGAANKDSRVVLRIRSDVTVTVKGPGGQLLLNRDLKAGDIYQVPNLPGLTMATSDAGAIEVDLDGMAMGRAGQSQQVLGRVSLDPQSLADRFNNR